MPPRKRKQAARQTDPEPSSDPPASSSSSSSGLNPAKMTVAKLREELEGRGLDTRGKKAELVARLQADIEAQGETATPAAKKPKTEEKEEEEEEVREESDFSKAVRALKSEAATGGKKKKRAPKLDPHLSMAYKQYQVVGEWDCMLNQTNIGQNNNKFYVIQMLERGGRYLVWNRWGRVGEPGQNAMKGPFSSEDAAASEFCKKFKDKTKNSWEDRDNFVPVKGKYTLLEMDDEEEGEEEMREKLSALDEPDAPPKVVRQCSLDKSTQNLIKLLFDHDMFSDAMKSMEIDTKKMPLGKLSKPQIAKGFEALEAIEEALNSMAAGSKLAELSSKFYTIIPHDFGRRVPPVINNHEMLQKKFDMLLVLGDIEIAQGLEKDQEKKQKMAVGEVPHPLDVNYELLKAKLSLVKKEEGEREYDVIKKYLSSTAPMWRNVEIQDVWRVDREGEGDRFSQHDDLDNRKLLWHGTNVAVVAAILKSGLRIMPHSGGRVGKGIYFASECSKSAGYVRCAGNTGIMFLNEVALGKEKLIERDDWTLSAAPPGYHSIVAKGRTEPDPQHDTTLDMDGKTVVIPQGNPIHQPTFSTSNFSQSEYLVYKESQVRIRYLLKMKM